MDKTLIMVEYVYTNVDEIFNGLHQTRFMAANGQEIIDKVKGLYQTFNEEFPESQYPNREMKVLNVYKCLVNVDWDTILGQNT